jgi:hypothetical protein
MTDCPKLTERQKMFHGRYVEVAKVQPITGTQTITVNVNVVDVDVTIKSKAIRKHVFKDRCEPYRHNHVR